MTQLSIVVPTFNERHNIEPLLMELRQALSGLDWECVVVDDDYRDPVTAGRPATDRAVTDDYPGKTRGDLERDRAAVALSVGH